MKKLKEHESIRSLMASSLTVQPQIKPEEVDMMGLDSEGSVKPEGLSARVLETDTTCVPFTFDIKTLSVDGTICSDGILTAKIGFLGITLSTITVDLSTGKYCQKASVGLVWGQFCFYIQSDCLYTSGYIDGTFQKKEKWTEKIVCF